MALGDDDPHERAVRTIQNVPGSSSVHGGESIQIDLEFSDGLKESIRCPQERAPRLMHAIWQASSIAEQDRKLQPGQKLQVATPYIAQDCQAIGDGQTVGIEFLTPSGFPVAVAMMSIEVAQKTVSLIENQLAGIGMRAPWKPS